MDFITHLPLSHGFVTIFVFVDRLSKYSYFIALPPNFTASKVVASFTKEYCRHYSIPRAIISDRNPLFMSQFWRKLLKLSGTTLKHSTTYHP